MLGLDYGNARVRAMRSRLLTPDDYARLTAADTVDGLVTHLADTVYGPDVEAALARFTGLRLIDHVVRRHLIRTLGALADFYGELDPGPIDLLGDRWDVRNLRIILRSRGRLESTDEALRRVVPVGRLTAGELAELAAQPTGRGVVDLLVSWRVPSRQLARRLLDALPEYEDSGEVAVLERALNAAYAGRLDQVLGDRSDGAAMVLRSEIDEINLMSAVRLRAARMAGEISAAQAGASAEPLAGGRLPVGALTALARSDDRSEAFGHLEGQMLPPEWTAALEAWVEDGDPVILADALQVASTRDAVALFSGGDPLGFDIPVAFTRAQEHEARNVYWVARGIAHGLGVDEIERRVVVIR
jgi:vacuolar-type H+-ATPase subunit C/Vma6